MLRPTYFLVDNSDGMLLTCIKLTNSSIFVIVLSLLGIKVAALCGTCYRCKVIHSTPDYVHDSELKEYSAEHIAQQQRAHERDDIFRSFSGIILC